jgi:hypothetical protein
MYSSMVTKGVPQRHHYTRKMKGLLLYLARVDLRRC